MFRDLFDRIHLAGICVVLLALVLLLGGFVDSGDRSVRHTPDPALERAMQEKARASFLLDTFLPVENLIADSRYAEALLKLQEFEKAYPGEPHIMILRGSILVAQEIFSEGVLQYAAAVKLNGDYVDDHSELNRRDEISQLVENVVPRFRADLKRAANPTLERSLKESYYLQSRLAGGCE